MKVQKEKPVTLPDDILLEYMNQTEIDEFKKSGGGIYSITVFAEKQPGACCSGCDC